MYTRRSDDPACLAVRAQPAPPAGRPAGRKRWRAALRVLGGPVVRMHHYRDVRTRLLRDVLDYTDCGSPEDACR